MIVPRYTESGGFSNGIDIQPPSIDSDAIAGESRFEHYFYNFLAFMTFEECSRIICIHITCYIIQQTCKINGFAELNARSVYKHVGFKIAIKIIKELNKHTCSVICFSCIDWGVCWWAEYLSWAESAHAKRVLWLPLLTFTVWVFLWTFYS